MILTAGDSTSSKSASRQHGFCCSVLHHRRGARTHTSARDVETEFVDTSLCGEKKRAPIATAPSHVVWMLGTAKRTEVLALRIENPQATRAADIHIAALVNFDTIDGVFTGGVGQVMEQFAFGKRTIGVHRITEDDLLLI